ncbi:MAG: four helix bundle protein [Acidobacteria bacterium]|nr:four helix bundle protein [Acidobacteriota bacterium]
MKDEEGGITRGNKVVPEPPVSPTAPPVAVQKCYDLVLYLLQRVEKFPRAQKFTVGDRLAEAAMDVLEDLVAAAYSRDKRELLERANLRLHRENGRCPFPLHRFAVPPGEAPHPGNQPISHHRGAPVTGMAAGDASSRGFHEDCIVI